MSPELALAVVAVLVAPAVILIGMLAVAGAIVVGLSGARA